MTGSCTFEGMCRRILGKRSDDRQLLIAKSSILHSAVFVLSKAQRVQSAPLWISF